jgi:Tfp pilus assembly PilM family ATPase
VFAALDARDNPSNVKRPNGSVRDQMEGVVMSQENTLRGTLLTVTRRYAAGIDVGEDAVRVAIVSRRLRANAAVCVEHLESVALPSGAVIGGDFVDRAAIVAALREAFARLPENGVWRALRCAIGLPASATLTTQIPLARLIDTHGQLAASIGGDPRGLLEPAVLAEAERAAGIERGALAVDWSVQTRENGEALVAIAATARRHVEARVEAAAEAGIALSAIDGEPAAALRAMRHAGSVELDADARYLVCWLESTGLHGWLVGPRGVEDEVRYPAPEHRSIADALHELAGERAPLDCIYVGGQIELMAHACLPLPMLGKTFGCAALPFEAAPYCNGAAEIPTAHKHSPRFAVAFGLALREVMQ